MAKEISFRVWLSIFFLFSASTAALLLVGLFYAVKLVQQPDFAEAIGDPFVELHESAFHFHDKSCEILIDGDSTAGNGIDPRVITAQTGLTACNIAANRSVVDGLGTMPLDVFLEHNPKPRLLMLQYGPEVFYRSRSGWEHVAPFSPIVMLARNRPRREAMLTTVKHPAEAVRFIMYVIQDRFFPRRVDKQRVHSEFRRIKEHAEESNGQIDLNLPPQISCLTPPQELYGPVDAGWIRQLHEKYEARGIAVLVRPSPIPSCDPQLTRFRHDLKSFLDFNVEPLPINFFVAGDRHKTQQGTESDTLILVNDIKSHHPDVIAKR
jgi:hypothetical protein